MKKWLISRSHDPNKELMTNHMAVVSKNILPLRILKKPCCIDLILTNCPLSFQNFCVIKTGLSNFHKMVTAVTKTTFRKLEPKVIKYRDNKHFCNDSFRKSLQNIFSQN